MQLVLSSDACVVRGPSVAGRRPNCAPATPPVPSGAAHAARTRAQRRGRHVCSLGGSAHLTTLSARSAVRCAAASEAPRGDVPRVAVVGAGILGACMALELARNGVPVTVVDRADRPGTVSTAASWAWLNANRKEPVHYRELNLMGMDIWKTDPLLSQLADFNGCIVLDDATGGQGEAYPSDPLTQDQLTAAEPGLAPLAAPPAHGTRIYRQEGLCDPVQATEAILAEAERLGARVIFGQSADYVHVEGGGVRLTLSGEAEAVEADAVVLAGGVDARTLAAGLGTEVPMLHRPGILVHTAPMPPGTLKHIVVAPSCYMLQRRDGVVVIGEDQNGSAGGARADDASADNGQRVLSVAARVLPALAGTELGRVTLGMRPYPADGLPVVGWLPRHEGKAYLMVSHSGVTLAPAIARLATKQILGQEVPALAHYATDRDFGTQGDNPYDLQFHGSGEQAMKREATAN